MSICRQLDHYKVRKGRYPRSEPSWSTRSPPPGRLVPSSSLWTPISLQGPALRCRILPGLLRSELNLGSPPGIVGAPARRIPVAATFSFLSFAALVGILGVSLLPARDQPTFAAEGQRTLPAAPSTTHRGKPAPHRSVSYRRGKPAAYGPRQRPTAPQRKNPRTKRTGGARRSPVRKPVPSGKRKLPQFKPTRTFAWVSQARAAYYQVAFFRNGRRFYQRRTRAPRVTVPRRVRFTPGDYRWTVQPAIRAKNGVRLADPIVDSTFRVGRD